MDDLSFAARPAITRMVEEVHAALLKAGIDKPTREQALYALESMPRYGLLTLRAVRAVLDHFEGRAGVAGGIFCAGCGAVELDGLLVHAVSCHREETRR